MGRRRQYWWGGGAAAAVAAVAAPAAEAQIIDETTDLLAPPASANVRLQVFTDLRFATNALAASNLPGGFEERAQSDVTWVKGVAASIAQPLAPKIGLFASGVAFHANFFKNDNLNFVGLRAAAGVDVRPSRRTGLLVAATCVSERDGKRLRDYYSYCGPIAGLSARIGRGDRTHLDIGVLGTLALGSADRFARFREAKVFVRLETGGRVRFSLEPSALIRDHSRPTFVPTGLDQHRVDYRGRLEFGLRYVGRRVEAGVVVEPAVSWSTLAQYRYWDLRVGPTLKVRF